MEMSPLHLLAPEVLLLTSDSQKGNLQAVAYTEYFHGRFIKWHMMVVCVLCALFVTSQSDVIFLFPNERFGKDC